MKFFFNKILLIGFLVTGSLVANAQPTYPDKPVTFIVPFPAGGGTDVGARLVAQKLSVKWRQSVIVDNKGGAGGLVGGELASRAKPDGYTIFIGNVGTQAINQYLYKKMPYDSDKAFTPICMATELPYVLLASPKFPPKTIRELVVLAKAEPKKITVASSGNGGGPHISMEMLQGLAGIQLLHVPYKGGGPAATDLMASHVDLLFASVLESYGSIKTGAVKGIAVTTLTRSPALPELPTISESGIPGFDTSSWVGLFAPAGTPKNIIDKIAGDVKEVIADPEVRQTLISQGATPTYLNPKEFKDRIASDQRRYSKLIKETGIQLE